MLAKFCRHELVDTGIPAYEGVPFYRVSFRGGDKSLALGYRVRNNSRQLLVFNGKSVSTVGLGRRVADSQIHAQLKELASK